MKIAFVDFCETLVDLQTADEYIEFLIREKEGSRSYKLFIIKFFRNRLVNKVLKRIFSKYKSPKSIILKLVKSYSLEDFNIGAVRFNKKLIEEYLIKDVLNEILKLKEENYKIIVVSGGYDIYINNFFPDIIDNVIATKILFKDGKCCGIFDGVDCLEDNKIIKIKDILDINDIDYEQSYTYSDSITDMPLFSLSKNKIVISKKESKKWAENEKFIQKIWHP
ncbi:HAD-IB family phosphatase [Photobacterium damselae]|uniref:HAD-IB family phosphatase n=1 Tax=Photobacterium damselae TaxID=38293 RepID=UPI0035A90D24